MIVIEKLTSMAFWPMKLDSFSHSESWKNDAGGQLLFNIVTHGLKALKQNYNWVKWLYLLSLVLALVFFALQAGVWAPYGLIYSRTTFHCLSHSCSTKILDNRMHQILDHVVEIDQ